MKKIMVSLYVGLMISGMLYAANEITTALTLKATKGYFDVTRTINSSFTLIHSAPNAAGFTQNITTDAAPTSITIGNVSTNGWGWFRNLTTNANTYIDIGWSDTTNLRAIVRMKPGEVACFRVVPSAALYGKASGTNSVLEKLIIDD